MAEYQEEGYEIPLQDKRYYGGGLKRKRVQFVRPVDSDLATLPSSTTSQQGQTASKAYLDIVLKTPSKSSGDDKDDGIFKVSTEETCTTCPADDGVPGADVLCTSCHLPLNSHHSSSIAHQLSLPHSHPPSSLDRQRKGLTILESQGWNPDQRLGLGAQGEGRLYPVAAAEKPDRYGVGHVVPEKVARAKTAEKLDAGKVRRMERERGREGARLREEFYRDEEVVRYLEQL